MDPVEIVNTGLTAVKLGAAAGAAIPFTALARRMLGPADEVAEMLRDSIRVYRYQRQLRLLQKAESMASKAHFTPETVSLKLLFPLLEGASLEENEDLHTMWAALLGNASHPNSISLVLPSFTEVLRVLTADEARLLDAAYKYARTQAYKSVPSRTYPRSDPKKQLDTKETPVNDNFSRIEAMKKLTLVDLGTYRDLFRLFLTSGGVPASDELITAAEDRRTSGRDLEIRYQFEVALEELQRLQMWTTVQGESREHFYLSSFGCQFMTVCNPPEAVKP